MTSAAAAAMTGDGREVIQRTIETECIRDIDDLNAHFEIEYSAQWINEKSYEKVALQFPDELLSYSVQVVEKLRLLCPDATIIILADVSYASCCVDDITAEHAEADCIIHYGQACLSPCYKYPVLYVYGRQPLDVADFKFNFCQKLEEEKVLVFYGVEYAYLVGKLRDSLNNPNVVFTTLCDPTKPADPDACCARHIPLASGEIGNYKGLYIGTHQTTLSNLIIGLSQCQFYSYHPPTKEMRKETVNVNRTLMKRYSLIERTKDAQIVGIIAGASGHRDYSKIVQRLKTVLKAAGKRYYTFLVGKLNVPKLANFMEIDVYVLVACHENALLETKDFYRPIVTPLEVEVACNPDRKWSPAFTNDFSQLLPDGSFYVAMPEKVALSADVSLVTGRISTLGTSDAGAAAGAEGAVVERNRNTALAAVSEAGEFLQSRSWTGLEQKLGQTPVTKAVEGLSGIARAYDYPPSAEGEKK